MLGDTVKRGGVLALVAMMLVSMVAAPAAAAATDLTWGAPEVEVSETGSTDTGIDVTADADGVNDTLSVDIVDSDGDVVTTYTQDVDVAANTTETVMIPLDASSSAFDLAPGEYTLAASVSGQTSTSTLTVTEDPSVSVAQDSYEVAPENDSVDVTAELAAGDNAATDDVVVQVLDENDSVVYETTETGVSLNASETKDVTYTIDSADVNGSDGDSYVVDVRWSGGVGTSSLDVVSQDDSVIGGGVVDDASSTLNDPVLIGGIVALVALLGIAAKAE